MAILNSNISQAAELLKRGEPVAIPTETVYGLAANALDAHDLIALHRHRAELL